MYAYFIVFLTVYIWSIIPILHVFGTCGITMNKQFDTLLGNFVAASVTAFPFRVALATSATLLYIVMS